MYLHRIVSETACVHPLLLMCADSNVDILFLVCIWGYISLWYMQVFHVHPLKGGVHLLEVFTYQKCPLIRSVHLLEVSTYSRCPLIRGVHLLEVSTCGRCPLVGGVHLLQVSSYCRCPVMGDVQLLEVSSHGTCPVIGCVHQWEVSTYVRCPLVGGVHLQGMSNYRRGPFTCMVVVSSERWTSIYRRCLPCGIYSHVVSFCLCLLHSIALVMSCVASCSTQQIYCGQIYRESRFYYPISLLHWRLYCQERTFNSGMTVSGWLAVLSRLVRNQFTDQVMQLSCLLVYVHLLQQK